MVVEMGIKATICTIDGLFVHLTYKPVNRHIKKGEFA